MLQFNHILIRIVHSSNHLLTVSKKLELLEEGCEGKYLFDKQLKNKLVSM